MNDLIELRQYAATALERWWIVLLGLLIGAALGYGISKRMTPIYQAKAALVVGQSIQATSLDSRDIQTSEMLALTYAEMAQHQPVLQGAIEELHLRMSWQQLGRQVRVQPIEGTQLLEVLVEADSPAEARQIADEIARQLILLSPTGAEDSVSGDATLFVEERVQSLQARIEGGQRRISELDDAMLDATSAEEMQALRTEIDTMQGLITDWESNYARLRSLINEEAPSNYLAVFVPAQARLTPIRPIVRLNTAIVSLLGLMLAIIFIFLLDYLDDSIKTAEEMQGVLNLTSLGTVGQIDVKNVADSLVTAQSYLSPDSEAYRIIRTNVQFMALGSTSKTIMVTSATRNEGKSTIVANLGVVMAQAGLRTIIVDADLKQPSQHRIFRLYGQKGLTDLIRDPRFDIEDYLATTPVEHLQVLTSGPPPPNSSDILGLRQIERLMTDLKERADVIIIDSTPAGIGSDAAVLSSRVDGVVMVVKANLTRRAVVNGAIATLQQAGATLMGAILNAAAGDSGSGNYGFVYDDDQFDELPAYKRFFRRMKPLPLLDQIGVQDSDVRMTDPATPTVDY